MISLNIQQLFFILNVSIFSHLISSLIMPAGHLRPFRNALYSSRSIADAVRAPHDGHPMAFTYSPFTPFLGSSWPARSSFAFWCPGYCSSGDVIATSPQEMSDQSPSPYPLFGLDRKRSVSFSYISCEKHPI